MATAANPRPRPSQRPYVFASRGHAAMTFEEIGRALGCTKKAAFMTYKTAMRKLRARPNAMRKLLELSRSKGTL